MSWKGGFSMKAAVLVLVLIAVLVSVPAYGQAPSPKKEWDDWNFYIAPAFYFAHLSGYAAVTSPRGENVELPLDLRFNQWTDHLDWGLGGIIQIKKAKWAFGLDLTHMELSRNQTWYLPGPFETPVKAKVSTALSEHEIYVGYQFNEGFPASDFIFGVRYVDHDIKTEVEVDSEVLEKELSMNFGGDFWVPFFGIRYYGPLSEDSKWSPFIRGDVGGVAIYSKPNWRFNFGIAWLFSKHVDLSLQYKWKQVSYVKGEIGDSDYYRVDLKEHGPQLGLGFRF
jgi:opacity protein-like surface antigen